MPFISTICPCYNQAHFLKSAIQSVLAQTFQDWEMLVIDDGSTDNTLSIAWEYAQIDSRIKVLTQSNQGLSSARNNGILNSTGNYLHFLDSDDLISPSAYQTIYQFSIQSPDVGLWISSYTYFDLFDFHTHIFSEKTIDTETLVAFNQAPPVANFLKKNILSKIDLFDTNLKSCEDWDLWLRVAKAGYSIKTIPDVLARYRYVSNSMSRNAKIMYQALSEVQHRALSQDPRIPLSSPYNKDMEGDISSLIKKHFIKCLGVSLHQGKVEEAVSWFLSEKEKWDWKFEPEDFADMNSQLTFRYFLDKEHILDLLQNHLQHFKDFFLQIGYTNKEIKHLLRIVFEPQLKKLNHERYGKYFGAVLNRLRYK